MKRSLSSEDSKNRKFSDSNADITLAEAGSPASTGLLVEYMAITEPLDTLRSLLELRTGLNLTEHQFVLQDTQMLDSSKNLVNQCVQGEGLVQINAEIIVQNGIKKINIIDVLKPAEELTATVNDEMSEAEEVTRWIVSEEFRKLMWQHNIPSDPSEWTIPHVRTWSIWAGDHFQVPLLKEVFGDMDGCALLEATPECLSIEPGTLFWTHLELLKKFKIVTVVQQDKSPVEKVKKRRPNPSPVMPKVAVPEGGGPIQLWQFLLELLTCGDFRDYIQWVGSEGEFKLLHPEGVAQLWGVRKNKPTMNYEKLSRALRYYYDGEMLAKVHGKRFVYKFVCDLKSLLGYDASQLNRLVQECEAKRKSAAATTH